MRKFFITAISLLVIAIVSVNNSRAQMHAPATSSFAEKSKAGIQNNYQNIPLKKNSNQSVLTAPPFFSEDFANGIPAGWSNVDNAGGGVVWGVTTSGAANTGSPVDEQLSSAGTSAANGYLILDSDAAGTVPVDASVTTIAINCTGHPTVHLAFNEYFAQYLISTGTVSVSNNNLTWTNIHNAEQGLVQDSGTANPKMMDIDITSVAANQATVYIRFTYVGNFDYWWFVDDLQLYEPSAIDLAAYSIEPLSNEYTMIPRLETYPTGITLFASVKNTGLNTANGGSVLFEVIDTNTLSQAFQETVNLPSMAPGSVQNLSTAGSFSAPDSGTYYVKITTSIAGDGNLVNNIITSQTNYISQDVYARDDGNFSEILGIGAGPGEDGIAGHNFKITGGMTSIVAVSFFLKDTLSFPPLGTPVFFTIRPQLNDSTPPDPIAMATTDTLWVTNGMIPAGGAWYTVSVQGGGIGTSPGLYFIGFHEVDAMIPMGYSNNIFTPGAAWVHWNSIPTPPAINGWAHAEDFGFSPSYMIRITTGIQGAINEQSAFNAISIYPNPAAGYFTISSSEIINSGTVEVIDLQGRVVHAEALNSSVQRISTSLLSDGIYTVRVIGNDGVYCTKLIVDKL